MSSISLSNIFYIILFFFLVACQSVEKVVDQTFNKEENIPEIYNIEVNDKIYLGTSININNLEKKFYLNEIKNLKSNQSKLKIIIFEDKYYTFNYKSELFINNVIDGKLVKKYQLIDYFDGDNLISNLLINNYFILGYSSGKINKVDPDGNVIWSFKNNKTFNSFMYYLDNSIIVFYGDEILSLNPLNGEILWSETYEDLPIIQAKGGQLVNFFNEIYFILPNGRLGFFDLNISEKNTNKFTNLDLQNSINNAKDRLYLFKNYLVYLDEGKFIYVYDLLADKFLLKNFKINNSSSSYFFNNTLIIKSGNYLEAINILNGNTFWLIKTELNADSKILNIKNINDHLYIFLDDGKIAKIDNNNIIEILDLKINKINSLNFINKKIITILKNGKVGIF